MFAAVAAGVYKDINEATRHMESDLSLIHISEAAGVSTALVSFVLNGKKKEDRVGEETCLLYTSRCV